MAQTSQPGPFAPVTNLGEGDALGAWRFIVGNRAQVRLLTAMGDVFLLKPHGLLRKPKVFLLDTSFGQLLALECSWESFKERIARPDSEVATWLKYDLLCALHSAGRVLQPGQCFSPKVAPFLGGKLDVENFEPADWRVHLDVAGQIFAQVKDLPPGTPITGIEIQ